MDIGTGKRYATKEEANAAGVRDSDLAFVNGVTPDPSTWERVQFTSGPFKGRVYRRNPITLQLMRVE